MLSTLDKCRHVDSTLKRYKRNIVLICYIHDEKSEIMIFPICNGHIAMDYCWIAVAVCKHKMHAEKS